jgi:uncharacterized protein
MASLEGAPGSSAGKQLIESYGGGGFRIAGVRHAGSVLVFPDHTLEWPVGDAADISAADLAEAMRGAESVRILVVGCGRAFIAKPQHLVAELRAAGFAVEWMATGAACRTFNVLLLEDREVAAALIAID